MVSSGRSARGVFWAVTLAHEVHHFIIMSSVLNPQIMEELSLNYTQLGFISGVSSLVLVPFQIMNSLITRYVSRRVFMALGSILSSLSCLLTGLANSFQGLLGARITGNIGQAGHDAVATAILSDKYDRKSVPSTTAQNG